MTCYSPQQIEAAKEKKRRIEARRNYKAFLNYTYKDYVGSFFFDYVCEAVDKFIDDVLAGKRPVIVFQAPPQHGKSELISRRLPPYLMGRFPDFNICAASYSEDLASPMAQAVKQNMEEPEYKILFPMPTKKRKYDKDATLEFNNKNGKGRYKGDGIGGGFTGRPCDIFIIDDPTKSHKEALSPTIKEAHWNWFQSCCLSRMSENSGIIVMATSWAEDDLPGRVISNYKGQEKLKVIKFPALNEPGEPGFNPDLPLGALVPGRHSREKLLETKSTYSDYWWAAVYQQQPMALGGNVFKSDFIQYYLPKDLPDRFDKVIASWDCTFKDTDGSDFVVGQVWGKKGSYAYLLDQVRERMSFTKTVQKVIDLKNKWPQVSAILIEDKANGPAVIDMLKRSVHGLIPVEPDGSKLARAHAVTYLWEARNVFLPSEDICPWVKDYTGELTAFPASANDDQVDAKTQALRYLFPLRGKLNISGAALAAVGAR